MREIMQVMEVNSVVWNTMSSEGEPFLKTIKEGERDVSKMVYSTGFTERFLCNCIFKR